VRIGRVKTHNNVHVKDPSVSQKHAELSWNGTCWVVTDLGSSNGTWVNDVEVEREGALVRQPCFGLAALTVPSGAPVPLKDGDVLSLGETTVFKLSLSAGAEPPGGLTVEAFLRAQCEAVCSRLKAEAEAEVALLRQESCIAIAELAALTASAALPTE
jgi:pSer/pThr/pTyr-binding forkhead associated (FHA) protein